MYFSRCALFLVFAACSAGNTPVPTTSNNDAPIRSPAAQQDEFPIRAVSCPVTPLHATENPPTQLNYCETLATHVAQCEIQGSGKGVPGGRCAIVARQDKRRMELQGACMARSMESTSIPEQYMTLKNCLYPKINDNAFRVPFCSERIPCMKQAGITW